jgi:hypothetical protein
MADRELVLEAVRQTGAALQYAVAELTADRVPALEVVRKDGRARKFAAAVLKADRELVLEAVRQDGRALQHAVATLQSPQLLITLCGVCPRQCSRQSASSSWRPCGRMDAHCNMPWTRRTVDNGVFEVVADSSDTHLRVKVRPAIGRPLRWMFSP